MIEDFSVEISSIKPVAKLAQIHLQMFRTGSMIGAVQKRFGVSDDRMNPKQMLCIRVEVFRDLGVSFS